MTARVALRAELPGLAPTDSAAPVGPPPSPHRAPRYADQPTSLGARLFGLGGVTAIVLVILAILFLTWRVYTAPPPAPALSVFDVEPPAAPPEPPSEVPSGPVTFEKRLPKPDAPEIKPPEIQIASENPITLPMPEPAPAPGPPAERTTAPERKPVPPAPQANGKPTWQGQVLAALNKAKRYPRDAHFARQQGVPYIRFTMDRSGKVLSVSLEHPSGVRSLDQEALALPRRAQPLPKPPEDVPGAVIELVVPVEFFIR